MGGGGGERVEIAHVRSKVAGEHMQVVSVGLVLSMSREALPSLCTVPGGHNG